MIVFCTTLHRRAGRNPSLAHELVLSLFGLTGRRGCEKSREKETRVRKRVVGEGWVSHFWCLTFRK